MTTSITIERFEEIWRDVANGKLKGEIRAEEPSNGKPRIDRALTYIDDKPAILEKDPAGYVVRHDGKIITVEGSAQAVDLGEMDGTAFLPDATPEELDSPEAAHAELLFESGRLGADRDVA
ncbi:hypothetical protein [Methylopila sp. 73B]|uniref:hypothetical protein n=1 Tax=Methylopila sp. 73B TaxID=1120792 RepID=UPI00035C769C|nr:hypothetical protein [Methylopila sp. 73B]